jgi:hypothetical protein
VVVNFFRWDMTGTYEYFALAEIVRPGMLPLFARASTITVV